MRCSSRQSDGARAIQEPSSRASGRIPLLASLACRRAGDERDDQECPPAPDDSALLSNSLVGALSDSRSSLPEVRVPTLASPDVPRTRLLEFCSSPNLSYFGLRLAASGRRGAEQNKRTVCSVTGLAATVHHMGYGQCVAARSPGSLHLCITVAPEACLKVPIGESPRCPSLAARESWHPLIKVPTGCENPASTVI